MTSLAYHFRSGVLRVKRAAKVVRKAEWNEADHPRADDGKFGSGGGGGKEKPNEKPSDKPDGDDAHAEAAQAEAARDWKENGVKSKAFKAWFGDWENEPEKASKVVDGEGKPQETHGTAKKVFHGTRANFDAFDKDKAGQNAAHVGVGFYFAEDQAVSNTFAGPNGKTIEAYLDIKNPLDFDVVPDENVVRDWIKAVVEIEPKAKGWRVAKEIKERGDYEERPMTNFDIWKVASSFLGRDRVNEAVRKLGHDGITHLSVDSGGTPRMPDGPARFGRCWIAFSPTQIKSTGNRGTFDPNDPHIGKRLKDFRESDHPRAADGKFGSGGSSAKPAAKPTSKPTTKPQPPKGIDTPEQLHAHADTQAKGFLAKLAGKITGAAAKALGKVKDGLKKQFAFLERRYGRKGAVAIFAGGCALGLATPLVIVPGSTAIGAVPFAAIAEVYMQARKLFGKDEQPLNMEKIWELAGELVEQAKGMMGEGAEKHQKNVRDDSGHEHGGDGKFTGPGGGGDSQEKPNNESQKPETSVAKPEDKPANEIKSSMIKDRKAGIDIKPKMSRAEGVKLLNDLGKVGWQAAVPGKGYDGASIKMEGGMFSISLSPSVATDDEEQSIAGKIATRNGEIDDPVYQRPQCSLAAMVNGSMKPVAQFKTPAGAMVEAEIRFKILHDKNEIGKTELTPGLKEILERIGEPLKAAISEGVPRDRVLPNGKRVPDGYAKCGKCDGMGTLYQYGHVASGVCFGCNGSGIRKDKKGKNPPAEAKSESMNTAVGSEGGFLVKPGERKSATWDESQHPRADDGKFGSGGGGKPTGKPDASGNSPEKPDNSQPAKPSHADHFGGGWKLEEHNGKPLLTDPSGNTHMPYNAGFAPGIADATTAYIAGHADDLISDMESHLEDEDDESADAAVDDFNERLDEGLMTFREMVEAAMEDANDDDRNDLADAVEEYRTYISDKADDLRGGDADDVESNGKYLREGLKAAADDLKTAIKHIYEQQAERAEESDREEQSVIGDRMEDLDSTSEEDGQDIAAAINADMERDGNRYRVAWDEDEESWVYADAEDLETWPGKVEKEESKSMKKTVVVAGYGSNCPTCGEPCVGRCRCFRADSHCKNGHGWHQCTVHKCLVVGKSDHGKPGCSCQHEGVES